MVQGRSHYWTLASLPFGYAMACVEVVSQKSERAGAIYRQIIEAWGNPGVNFLFKGIYSEISAEDKEYIKQAFIHPEKAMLPDPDKPFKEFEELFANMEINKEFIKEEYKLGSLSQEEQNNIEELLKFSLLIMEFIIVGFNRESDIEKGKIRVFPSNKHIWLILAVMLRTSCEHVNIKLENIRNLYLLRKSNKGELVDYHKVLTEQPMSRAHRRMIALGKKVKLRLKNDNIFMNAAQLWYQCRVVYPSVNKYCDAQSLNGNQLDSKNIEKKIKQCDEAIGYQGRLRKQPN